MGVQNIVSSAVGRSVGIGRCEPASAEEVVDSLKEGLEYQGDVGSHPSLDFVATAEYASMKAALLGFFTDFCTTADQILCFRFTKGHPFYPVFWDFAYVIQKNGRAYVFVGSSSD